MGTHGPYKLSSSLVLESSSTTTYLSTEHTVSLFHEIHTGNSLHPTPPVQVRKPYIQA